MKSHVEQYKKKGERVHEIYFKQGGERRAKACIKDRKGKDDRLNMRR